MLVRPEAHFSQKNTSAPIVWPDVYFGPKYFGPEILWLETPLTHYTSAREPKFQKCHFAPSIGLGGASGKHHHFNLYKPTFSIKAYFLIWSYQACNNSYKLVICMATNLVLEKIKLIKIKSTFHLYIVHLTSSVLSL